MKYAVITGASSGLGKEYIYAVLKSMPEIEKILIIARREDRLNSLKEELGEKIAPMPGDITDGEFIRKYSDYLKSEKAEVKLLINNAGFGRLADFTDISTLDNAAMVRLNCEALTVMTSVTLSFMTENSNIINTCSIAAFAPNARMAVYSSTKAYVLSLSRALKMELKSKNIYVTAVCPGPMDTEFLPVANIKKGTSRTFDTLPRVNPKIMAEKSLKAALSKKAVYTNKAFYKFYRFIAKILPCSLVMKWCKT